MASISHAKRIFNYLVLNDRLRKSDIIMGFGHFDLRIPYYCSVLYKKGYAPLILFAGGIGSGSADLTKPEGQLFLEEALNFGVPRESIVVETKSTNTAQNILCGIEIMKSQKINVESLKNVIIVANPYRQRRVWLTCRKIMPQKSFINCPPLSSFEEEVDLFMKKDQDLKALLVGEIERIIKYGELGYIVPERIPDDILDAYDKLRRQT